MLSTILMVALITLIIVQLFVIGAEYISIMTTLFCAALAATACYRFFYTRLRKEMRR